MPQVQPSHGTPTRSPIVKRSASGPASTTVPTISWPGTSGNFGSASSPSTMCRSVRQTAHALTPIRSCPGRAAAPAHRPRRAAALLRSTTARASYCPYCKLAPGVDSARSRTSNDLALFGCVSILSTHVPCPVHSPYATNKEHADDAQQNKSKRRVINHRLPLLLNTATVSRPVAITICNIWAPTSGCP